MVAKYARYAVLIFILTLLLQDSFNKFYKGTSHRFIYPNTNTITDTSMEKWIADARKEMGLLNNKLLELNKGTEHFYRIFTPQNHFLYLAGIMQQHKIHEAAIYESSISKNLRDFYDAVILGRTPWDSKELKSVMPYFLFTKHVHKGLNLDFKEIAYNDFFLFSPSDINYIQNQNIEFFWDLMQVKYLIIESELSRVLERFNNKEDYKMISKYPQLNLNLYEIRKNKNYAKLAILPLEDQQSYDEVIEQINSKDINILKKMYSKLLFLDKSSDNFALLKVQNYNNKRYYEINSRQKAILIDFESWHYNWKLKVNNEDEKVMKAFWLFKGITISPGLNRIELVYYLKWFKELFLISLLVILAHLVLLGKWYYKEK